MKGLFITFEGIDGCGKSTHAKKTFSWLKRNGYPALFTREPGGTPIAEKIREIILDPANLKMTWKTELLLYNACRAQHIQEKILPALEKGKIVVCDRFDDATVAYQGFGRKLPHPMIAALHHITAGSLKPDRSFILDVTMATAKKRLAETDKVADRLESVRGGFMERVRRGYRAIARTDTRRCRLIDASGSREQTRELILGGLRPILKRKFK